MVVPSKPAIFLKKGLNNYRHRNVLNQSRVQSTCHYVLWVFLTAQEDHAGE